MIPVNYYMGAEIDLFALFHLSLYDRAQFIFGKAMQLRAGIMAAQGSRNYIVNCHFQIDSRTMGENKIHIVRMARSASTRGNDSIVEP